jgi:hypothetical protein
VATDGQEGALRGCGQGIVLTGALLVFLAAVAFWFLARPPALAQGITPVPVSSAAAGSFDQKLATVQAAPAPVTVEITEAEATSKLAETLAAEPSAPRLENPQVTFREGKVILSGVSRDAPIPVTIVVVGRVEARDGELVTTVEQIDTGRFPLPGALRDQITGIASDTDRLNAGLPIVVDDVRTLDGRLVLTGRPK